MHTKWDLYLTLRAFALRYTPSKATQLLVSPTDLRFRKAYLALGPAAAELLSYRVQEVTADPCSSVSVATALVSVMMVSKKEVSWLWVVSKGMLPTYSRLAALPAFSAAACVTVYKQGSVVLVWVQELVLVEVPTHSTLSCIGMPANAMYLLSVSLPTFECQLALTLYTLGAPEECAQRGQAA